MGKARVFKYPLKGPKSATITQRTCYIHSCLGNHAQFNYIKNKPVVINPHVPAPIKIHTASFYGLFHITVINESRQQWTTQQCNRNTVTEQTIKRTIVSPYHTRYYHKLTLQFFSRSVFMSVLEHLTFHPSTTGWTFWIAQTCT